MEQSSAQVLFVYILQIYVGMSKECIKTRMR